MMRAVSEISRTDEIPFSHESAPKKTVALVYKPPGILVIVSRNASMVRQIPHRSEMCNSQQKLALRQHCAAFPFRQAVGTEVALFLRTGLFAYKTDWFP